MSRINVFQLAVILMVMAFLTRSCAVIEPGSSIPPVPKEVQISEEGGACGSGVGLNIGDTLVLILEGNPSTGYTWEVGFYVPEVVKPAGGPEFHSSSNLAGAGGEYTFRFVAVGEGQVTLRMIYHRPWEMGVKEFKTCEVNVNVK